MFSFVRLKTQKAIKRDVHFGLAANPADAHDSFVSLSLSLSGRWNGCPFFCGRYIVRTELGGSATAYLWTYLLGLLSCFSVAFPGLLSLCVRAVRVTSTRPKSSVRLLASWHSLPRRAPRGRTTWCQPARMCSPRQSNLLPCHLLLLAAAQSRHAGDGARTLCAQAEPSGLCSVAAVLFWFVLVGDVWASASSLWLSLIACSILFCYQEWRQLPSRWQKLWPASWASVPSRRRPIWKHGSRFHRTKGD